MKIHWNKIKEELNNITGLAYFDNSGGELITRCYKCERESTSDHGHLYISTDIDLPAYNCFKCNESGNIITLLGLYGLDANKYIDGDLKNLFKGTRKILRYNVYDYKLTDDSKDIDHYAKKVKYLKDRLGEGVNVENIPNVVFNIKKFINENNIEISDRLKDKLNWLNEEFVGFLGINKSLLILRNCNNNSKFRYHNVYLGTKGRVRDFYGYKTSEIKENSTNSILLCEGIFDLLKAYKYDKLSFLRDECCYWASILNSSYKNVIPYVLLRNNITSVNLVILSDSNYNESQFFTLYKLPYVNNIEIYYNRLDKDFGSKNVEICRVFFDPKKYYNKR